MTFSASVNGESFGSPLSAVQVKELGRFKKQAALYCLSYPDGHRVWRITKPIGTDHNEIPTSLWPEFSSEKEARVVFGKITGWEFTTTNKDTDVGTSLLQ